VDDEELYAPAVKRCPSCGEENADRARFCSNCATALGELDAPAADVRKVVTIVFADVTGSTALGERLDPEALRRVMERRRPRSAQAAPASPHVAERQRGVRWERSWSA
jgi:class 3 adenylate cyclase